jgi:excisionase family DNA binding protein
MTAISSTEAAERLGISRMTVTRWIKTGKLRGHKSGKNWIVDELPEPVDNHSVAALHCSPRPIIINVHGRCNMDDDFFEDETDYRSSRVSRGHPLTDLKLIGPFLEQLAHEARWCSAGGQYVEVARMSASHAAATINFLLRRARDIAVTAHLAAGNNPQHYENAVSDEQAREWLLSKPLLVGLIAQALAGGEKRNAFPWEG